MGNKIAELATAAMATWTFIALVLIGCLLEIYGNSHGWFHFDPTMLVLNTILSLWAAVQGSIIMINQNQADKRRDAIMKKILVLEKHILKKEKEHDQTKETPI